MSNRMFHILKPGEKVERSSYDGYLSFFDFSAAPQTWAELVPRHFDKEERQLVLEIAKRQECKIEAGKFLSFDRHPLQRWLLVLIDNQQTMYQMLELARQLTKALKESAAKSVLIDLRELPSALALPLIDALVAAQRSLSFVAPKYSQKPKGKGKAEASPSSLACLDFQLSPRLDLEEAQLTARRSDHSALAANQSRYLTMQAGNDLTPKKYAQTLKQLAATEGLGYEFISSKKLQTMGAGAFLAVAQGSENEDAGIVKLSYEPQKKRGVKQLTLVGKGITFDTGGTNLKSAAYMWGMHRDMAGSAIAFGLIQLAVREKWPLKVTAYLAITDNATGPRAYRQNDVVTALSGKTIEIVHTDAEGRMVLADTLYMAAEEKPDLLIDFATLTGACVAAISTRYAGVFTNRPQYHAQLIEAGQESGERIWPFPLDRDFAECLKSDIADIKQCRLTGGVDHIEAALFLQEFVSKQVPWIHFDLSSAENSGGLGHVETETTGFGVRVGERLIRQILLAEKN